MSFFLINAQGGQVLGSATVSVQDAQGHPACNPSAGNCINPLPCADCSGQWTDNYQDTFIINHDSQGVLTGSSGTFNSPYVQNGLCPAVTYTLNGQFVPVYGDSTTPGRTDFVFEATNPDHGSTANCQVSTNTRFMGSIPSAGGGGGTNCGHADGTWTNSLGYSGTFRWDRACNVPSGNPAEKSTFVEWGNNYGQDANFAAFTATISGNINWDGRDVIESAGAALDTCAIEGIAPPAVTGGLWHVGILGIDTNTSTNLLNNTYGLDFVGDTTATVTFIKNRGVSCRRTVEQIMKIFCSTPTLWRDTMPYAYHTNRLTRWYTLAADGSVTYKVGRGDDTCSEASCSPAK